MATDLSRLRQKHRSINLMKDSGGAIAKKRRVLVIYRACAGILGLVILISSSVYSWTYYELQKKAQLEDQLEARRSELKNLLPVLATALRYKDRMSALDSMHFDQPSVPRQSLLHLQTLGDSLNVDVKNFHSTQLQLAAHIETDGLADFNQYSQRLSELQTSGAWSNVLFSKITQNGTVLGSDLNVIINAPKPIPVAKTTTIE